MPLGAVGIPRCARNDKLERQKEEGKKAKENANPMDSSLRSGLSGEGRLPIPSWAVNDDELRELLVRFLELRAGFRRRLSGTSSERFARAQEALSSQRPAMTATLDRLCREYVALKRSEIDQHKQRLRLLEIQIENLDTRLRLSTSVATVVLGIVYYYYRAGLDSVGVAAELGLKPPHVRMVLSRLHRVWSRMRVRRDSPSATS